MRGKNPAIGNTLPSEPLIWILWRNQKFYRAKAKRIQHHQTSFTTHVKGTSPGKKERPQLEIRKLQDERFH